MSTGIEQTTPLTALPSGAAVLAEPAPRSGAYGQVKIRNGSSIELRYSYALGPRELYTIDTYFFVPRNIGLNRTNFTKEQFYSDVTSLLRLATEPLPLSELADMSRASSPLQRFAAALEQFRSSPNPPPSRPVAVHVKLYAFLYTMAVKAELKRLASRLDPRRALHEVERAEIERAFSLTLRHARDALWAFRKVRAGFRPFEQLCHGSLAGVMHAADEHMSLYLEERLSRFSAALDRCSPGPSSAGFVVRCRLAAAELAREEAAYRKSSGYLMLDASDPAGGEYFTYRASVLKKSVHSALYLGIHEQPGDTFVRNAVGAVGAALAAIWAFATQLPMSIAEASASAKAMIFAVAVLTYVTKDRIKALTNEHLLRRLRDYDHASWLNGESWESVGLGMLRARLRESMRFLSPAELPPDIRAARLSHQTVRFAETADEEVLHLRRVLDLGADGGAGSLPSGYRLHDVLRLNLRHFLARLDDPQDRVAYFDERHSAFASADLPKVYHLNVVVKIAYTGTREPRSNRVELLRVILCKDGIVRVEEEGAIDGLSAGSAIA